jgi:hypothetical protein
MCFPRNWEFGSDLSKLRNNFGGGLNPPNPPTGYAPARKWIVIHWCRKSQILWMQRLWSYWQQLLGIVDTSQEEGGGTLKTKFWFCVSLRLAQNPILFFRHCSLFHQDEPYKPSSILFILGQASIHLCLIHFLTLQKMSEKDRYCCLLFDEMSIRENVRFNQKFDCIEGIEDLGSQGRMCNIANHSLLFMVCSLHQKWKQPVA